ncbi:hypothetical protein [Anaerotignum sp.]|uniref:hypothetical protein n=1 Tax=Anaerotignum sp. TaxID=2039241 RepID=UPI0028A6EA2B|nr:hypothetical protein [Anaerotignum sp.]
MLDAINNKELGFMDILSISMNLFMKNFKSIMIVVTFLFLPISILNVLIVEKLSNSALILMNMVEAEGFLETMPAYTEALIRFLGNHALQMTVLLFLEPIGVIAIAKIAKGYLCNETIKVKDAIGEAMNCLWGVIVTGIPYWVLIFIASTFFVIPGLVLGVFWTFYVYAIGLKDIRGWKALTYSKKLTGGKFWKTTGFIIVTSFIVSGWNWLFKGLLFIAPEHVATNILYSTLTYISGSFAYMGVTVLFMNRGAIMFGEKYYPNENIIESTEIENKE